MSRIYDALKNAQEMREEIRAKNGLTVRDGLGVMEMTERRASPREQLDIELTVYGHASEELPFFDLAKAIKGNAYGGLLKLAFPVIEGQDLLLVNNRTSEEQICRVLSVTIQNAQSSEVAVVFPAFNAEFWGGSGASANTQASRDEGF